MFLPLTDAQNPEGARIRARLEKLKSGSAPFQWGRGTANLAGIAQALLEISSGFGSTGGGMALTSTGVGAPVGAVAMAVGGASVQDLSNLISYVFASSNSGSGGSGDSNIEKAKIPEIGNKLDFIFGKASGNAHNIQRSQTMLRQMESVGLPDTPATRQLLKEHLTQVLNNPNNISSVQSETGRVVRQSLLMGPRGALKVESVWDGNKLITVVLKGGR